MRRSTKHSFAKQGALRALIVVLYLAALWALGTRPGEELGMAGGVMLCLAVAVRAAPQLRSKRHRALRRSLLWMFELLTLVLLVAHVVQLIFR